MIDIHSHIIPEIDDGARSYDMAIEMARQAQQNGITHMVCTPHVHWQRFDNTEARIKTGHHLLQQRLDDAGIKLTLQWAAEVRANEMVPVWIKAKSIPFIGVAAQKKVLLLELPHSHIPGWIDQLLTWLTSQSITALIPHPERNRDVWEKYDFVNWLRKQGCLMQVTAGAYTGTFGRDAQRIAQQMLEDGYIDFVASDTHDPIKRPNEMAAAFDLVAQHAGQEAATRLFVTHPASLTGISLF